MLRIAMCDENASFLFELRKMTLKISRQISPTLAVEIVTFSESAKLIESVQQGSRYDLIMLEWEMPVMDGEAIVKAIRQVDPDVLFVFITSNPEYVLNATRLMTFRYILKENLEKELPEALRSVYERQVFSEKRLIIKTRMKEEVCLKVKDIIYLHIEKITGQTIIVTKDAEYKPAGRTFFRDNMNTFLGYGFVPSFKGVLINPREIKEIQKMDLHLSHNKVVPVSRNYKKGILDTLHHRL